MKVLFLVYDWVIEPLGISYISSALKKSGHEVKIVKTKYEANTSSFIDIWQPDILAFSVTTGWHSYYLDLNREIRQWYKKGKSVFGGPHATYMPEMINEEGVDVVMRGECEQSFPDLLDVIDGGLGRHKRVVEPYPLEQDLDKIDFPDRELIYSYPENRDNPIANVMMSRGCPFSCSFCFNSINLKLYKGQKTVRYHSISNVIEECVQIKEKYPQKKMIFWQDDEFVVRDIKILGDFLDTYKEEVGLPFHCQFRAEQMTEEKANMLKKAGCISVTFAIESGNELIRNKLLKKHLKNEDILNCVDILKRVGLKFRAENMIGIPGETIDEALETLDLNIKIKSDVAWCALFQPYPKTELGELCKSMLLWNGSYEKIEKDFFTSCPIKRDRAKEFNNLQKIFGLVVEYPELRPFVRALIKMPENGLLRWISDKFKHYCYNSKLYKVN